MEVIHTWRQKWLKMLRARYGETHLDFDLHDCLYVTLHGVRRNTKENCRKLSLGREALVRCEILERAIIQAQGRSKTTKRGNLVQTLGGKGNAYKWRWLRRPWLWERHSRRDSCTHSMAGNGTGRNGGKHRKQVVLENGASSTAPPTFRVSSFIYSWTVLWGSALLIACRRNNFGFFFLNNWSSLFHRKSELGGTFLTIIYGLFLFFFLFIYFKK
jgi:hypothetical protein